MNDSSMRSPLAKSVSATLRGLASPYALSVLNSLKQGGQSPDMPNPMSYTDAQAFAVDYQAWNILRKAEVCPFRGKVDKDKALKKAVRSFLEVEERLRYINRKGYIPGTAPFGDMPAPEQVLWLARRKIQDCLGAFDPDVMIQNSVFTSGASTRVTRSDGNPSNKYTGKPQVTRNCALLGVCAIWHSPAWRSYFQDLYGRDSDPLSWVEVVEGSEYFTVPKTFESIRGAAMEAELNMYLQKGIGEMIRNRLRRVRVDLNDQTWNQYLASCGARTGALATIDLAAASDSVGLVLLELLPADWARFIRLTRSEKVKLPCGTWHTLEKVSSMGNGFTFELESLLFWALTSASVALCGLTDRRIGIYGDDIICHRDAAPTVINTLAYLGFETNVEKTFVDGPFRESCGKHYFYGCDVTPFMVKDDYTGDPDGYHYINRLALWSRRANVTLPRELGSYLRRQLIRAQELNFVPPHFGTRAGMLARSVGEALGVYVSIAPETQQSYVFDAWLYLPCVLKRRKNGKRYWAPVQKHEMGRHTEYGAYLNWQDRSEGSKPLDQGYYHRMGHEALEVSSALPTGVEERWVKLRRFSSEWSDCDIGLFGE